MKINDKLEVIRCNRFQYLVKRGTLSNYSFDIIDEDKSGILENIFEKINWPVPESELIVQLQKETSVQEEEISKMLKELKDLEVLLHDEVEKNLHIHLFSEERDSKYADKFKFLSENVQKHEISEIGSIDLDEMELFGNTQDQELMVVLSRDFLPNVFYTLNSVAVEKNIPLIIAYMDGDEGILIPLMKPQQSGCYNDFEILRESSFYNLIEYQVRKEEKIKENKTTKTQVETLYYESLIHELIYLIDKTKSHSRILSFAYSFDFERLVRSKTRLLRFPGCPSCHGDKNITHPFI